MRNRNACTAKTCKDMSYTLLLTAGLLVWYAAFCAVGPLVFF